MTQTTPAAALTIPHPRPEPRGAAQTGRWDALDVPAEAGDAVLSLPGAHPGPAVRRGDRMLLLVPEGSAQELPGLLDWLEWNGVELELRAHSPAPVAGPAADSRRGAGHPSMRPPGADTPAPPAGFDLARLVSAVATECHRTRLARNTRPRTQP